MAGLTIFQNGAGNLPSQKFAGINLPTQRLDDGVSAGFPRISYKGSKWGTRYQGVYHPILATMADGSKVQSPYLDIVILKASGHPNKAYYAGAYSEGETTTPPDCWSSNGQAPDAGSPHKQSKTCAGCVHNVWGSKVNRDTGAATRGKACMDSKRLAVVPVGDIMNETYGGPMMLSVPPSSLKRLGPYQNMLQANGLHYAAVWTRITFDGETSYPLFNFDAIAALNDVQAEQVIKMFDHPTIDRILDADQSTVEAWDESAQAVHAAIQPGAPGTAAEAMAAAQAAKEAAAAAALAVPTPAVPATPAPIATPATPAAVVAKTPEQIEAEIAERVRAAVAAASKPAATGTTGPVGEAGDPGPIPQHLVRQPTTVAPEPQAEPLQAEAPEPQAEPPETPAPALPTGMVLPPGMTPEMAAAFMSSITAANPPKQRRRRTPPVSPAAGDTSQPATPVAGLAGAGLPIPSGMAPAGTGPVTQPSAPPVSGPAAGGQDAAVAKIMGSIQQHL